jgi:hypothetical protein
MIGFPHQKISSQLTLPPPYVLLYNHIEQSQENKYVSYFLDNIQSICTEEYVLSDSDILKMRRVTLGISYLPFTYKKQSMMLIDAGGQEHARRERELEFHDLFAVFYMLSLDDFDCTNNAAKITRLDQSLAEYKMLCDDARLASFPFAVLLNKSDRLVSIVYIERRETAPLHNVSHFFI